MRLPHRFPFQLTGRAAAGVEARVLVSGNEFWSRGDRPRGLGLWVETIAQAAAQLLDAPGAQAPAGEHVLAGIEGFEVVREPTAGAEVAIEVEMVARLGSAVRVGAVARDDRGVFARGHLVLVRN